MTTSQLIDAIKNWTAANGRGPTFNDLHGMFGGDADTIEEELDKARQANMIDRDVNGHYFVI